MKKLGIVLGAAVVATLAGCKDPAYKSKWNKNPQDEVKPVPAETAPAPEKETAPAPEQQKTQEPEIVTTEKTGCTCPPGTKHTAPCACGAADCSCEVVPPAPESVVYIVQRNDTLSKISKKYNVKMSAIYKLNPSIKGDVIRIGQKLKLPAGTEVGEQKAPEQPAAKSTKKTYVPYTGATKEYVVKSGDTLGAIAYGNGINIRQLKELNGLSSDVLRVGQKLKVPADGKKSEPVAKAAAPKAAPKAAEKVEAAPAPEVAPAPVEAPVVEEAPAAAVAEAEPAPEAAPVLATTSYVVQEGDDMTSVSISFGVSAAAIRELNNLGDGDQLKPGQVIRLPSDTQQ